MQRRTIFGRSMSAAYICGAICFAFTFCIPLVFYFLFAIMPLSGDTMGEATRFLWAPLKLIVEALLPFDLWQYLNPIYAAPFINALIGALIAFGVCYLFLHLRDVPKEPPNNQTSN